MKFKLQVSLQYSFDAFPCNDDVLYDDIRYFMTESMIPSVYHLKLEDFGFFVFPFISSKVTLYLFLSF